MAIKIHRLITSHFTILRHGEVVLIVLTGITFLFLKKKKHVAFTVKTRAAKDDEPFTQEKVEYIS